MKLPTVQLSPFCRYFIPLIRSSNRSLCNIYKENISCT
jgi:hypothetical protein